LFTEVYKGRRVLVTGHTGFKGSWLSLWLLELGAEVAGLSISELPMPSNFSTLELGKKIHSFDVDIRDREAVIQVFREYDPEIVFHLAAQAVVREGYESPVLTLETNAFGTLNVLEAIRQTGSVETAVLITSDKCYKNAEWVWGYRENDSLGGGDPYSASKACAENIAATYIESYFSANDIRVATARSGNVVGGGDWAPDRIVPDCVRAWSEGRPANIRNPDSTRPWLHVLESLSGYLWLGAKLWLRHEGVIGEAFNFGPSNRANQSVSNLVDALCRYWPNSQWEISSSPSETAKEFVLLQLNSDKAKVVLEWFSVLSYEDTVAYTGEWYENYYSDSGRQSLDVSQNQIRSYTKSALNQGLQWAY
jgi:CDP-glucose 4,6-dehydratase